MKRVFLYVSGGDYAALAFEENFNAQKVYEKMVRRGLSEITVSDGIDIIIKEFGEIDDKFIEFMKDHLCDYDQLKDADIFEVKPAKEED